MFVEVYEWSVFDKLKEGKKVCAIDTKQNILYDLADQTVESILFLLRNAEENANRFFFYYWQEEDKKNEQM